MWRTRQSVLPICLLQCTQILIALLIKSIYTGAMSKPIAVLISDVHYTLKTLQLADTALRAAIDKAANLRVPLIDCGDLTNDKAILRAEVVNTLIETGSYAADTNVFIVSLVGNHSLINERSTDANALNFLLGCETWNIIKYRATYMGFNFIPYQPTRELFLEALAKFPRGSLIIAHQGLTKAWPGEYCHDHSAVYPEDVADYRIVSGHYHRAQDIKTGRPQKGAVGLWSYVGTPYTTSFAEAEDGCKGFQILYDDGLLELVPTNLRKHVIIEMDADSFENSLGYDKINPEDLVWLKMRGSRFELDRFTKNQLGEMLQLPGDFRLDKIPTDTQAPAVQNIEKKSGIEILDELVDSSGESDTQKQSLKQLAREIL